MTTKRTLLVLGICAATLTASLAPADAQSRRRGGAVAAGVVGGLLAGALIAGAAGAQARPAPVYDAPVLEEERYCRRRHVGYDRYGDPVFRTICH
jgi:hypothetical protein